MKITKPINFALVALAGFTFACGGGEKTSETTSTAEVQAPVAAPEVDMSQRKKISTC